MRKKVTIIAAITILAVVMSAALAFAGTTESIGAGYDPAISKDGTYVVYVSWGGQIYVRNRSDWSLTYITLGYDGNPGSRASVRPSISCDGRYVAFESFANNLVPGDNNRWGDIFVHDMLTGEKVIVSVSNSGTQGNFHSSIPDISCDGRYVAFRSIASNLVPGDSNGTTDDIFVHDRDADGNGIFDEPGGTSNELVSVASSGIQSNGRSIRSSISDDGRYVVFTSSASNLVPDDTNGTYDVFLRDRRNGETILISIDENGDQLITDSDHPRISGDGKYVVFASSGNLHIYDISNGTSKLLRNNISGNGLAVNSDGRYVGYINNNSAWSVMLYDTLNDTVENVSVNSDGNPFYCVGDYPDISGDGRYAAFSCHVDYVVYVRDRGPQNASPTADAGADLVTECVGPEGATVTLDGSGSTDPDGDALTYTWTGTFGIVTGVNAMVTLPLGTHTVTLTVDDGNSGTDTDEVVITVADNTPPVITIFGISDGETYALGLVPEASYDVMDTCSGVASSNALLLGGGDICSDSFTYKVTATDNAGNEGTETTTYEVIATADGLIALIHQMVLDGLIASEMENSLVSKLQNGAFKAFINQVEAQTRSDGKNNKKIDPAAAAMLISAGSCF